MKTFCVFRHAKSSWEEPLSSDAERPLLATGIERTGIIAEYLVRHEVSFDLLVSSPARRALETSRIIARALNYRESDIRIDASIYSGGAQALEEILMSIDDAIDSVALFGHNPGMTSFVNEYLTKPVTNFPTSAAACFEADIVKWSDLPASYPRELFYISPKNLTI